MKTDKKAVGERIARVRKGLGMSREKFGASLPNATSRQVVAQWETGIALPSMDRLLDISEIGKVSLDYLIKEGDISDYVFALTTYVTGFNSIITNNQEAIEGMKALYLAIGEDYTEIEKEEMKIIEASKAVLDLCNQTIHKFRKQRINKDI